MKTVTLYTKEEIEAKWPTLTVFLGDPKMEKVLTARRRLEEYSPQDLADGGLWIVELPSRIGKVHFAGLIDAIGRVRQHIEKHP